MVDLETTGPNPHRHNLLSVGMCVVEREADGPYRLSTRKNSHFLVNILRDSIPRDKDAVMSGHDFFPPTLQWWKTQPEAWAACRKDPVGVRMASLKLYEWLERNDFTQQRARLAAWPVSFDVTWLFKLFLFGDTGGISPFGHSAYCLGSVVNALRTMGVNTRDLFAGIKNDHQHDALADALEQGEQLARVLNFLEKNECRLHQPSSSSES